MSDEKPTSIWKKELSFKRKPKEEPFSEPVAAEAEVAPVPAAPAPEAPPPLPTAPEPVAIDHGWLTQPLELVSTPDEQPTVELPAEPPTSVFPAELDPALTFAPSEPLPPVSSNQPELPPDLVLDVPLELPAELLAAASAALAPPEPAAPAPAVESKPFYKRELSFRKPKPEPEAAEPAGWEETDVRKPFYKRELSFGRRSKAAADDAPVLEQEPKPAREKRERPKLALPKLALPKLVLPKLARRKPALPSLARPQLPSVGSKGGKKLVGLKIGASQIAAARIVNGEEPQLVQAVRSSLEPGIVVGGELRDPEALAVALKDFFRKHGLPKRGVRLGIANNRIGVRTFDVTGIEDPKQLANAIRFRAQEVLPIPIEEAVLDYHVLSESTDADGVLTRRVLLVVAYRELVDRYVLACEKAGIQIVGIDLEAFALLRALGEPRTLVPGDDRGALVAVSVGHDRSTFAVSDGRNCEFTRVLEWGGWALNVAIARALDLSPGEAEPVKRALSLTGGELLPDGFDEDQLETAREAARKQLQSFARELVSSLQFYQNQPGSLGIGEIVLTGGTTHLPGFAAELERLIGVPVRVGDPLARLKVSKKIREDQQTGSFAIAIGLGIED
jgi:type IV pilus assembly protein PilM